MTAGVETVQQTHKRLQEAFALFQGSKVEVAARAAREAARKAAREAAEAETARKAAEAETARKAAEAEPVIVVANYIMYNPEDDDDVHQHYIGDDMDFFAPDYNGDDMDFFAPDYKGDDMDFFAQETLFDTTVKVPLVMSCVPPPPPPTTQLSSTQNSTTNSCMQPFSEYNFCKVGPLLLEWGRRWLPTTYNDLYRNSPCEEYPVAVMEEVWNAVFPNLENSERDIVLSELAKTANTTTTS